MKYLGEALQWPLNIQAAQCASGNSDVQDEEEKKISGSGENQITFFSGKKHIKANKELEGGESAGTWSFTEMWQSKQWELERIRETETKRRKWPHSIWKQNIWRRPWGTVWICVLQL